MLFSNFRSTPYLCCVSVHGWVNKTNLTTGLPKSYDIYQLWCLTPACPCHKVLKQKLTVRLLIRSFTRGSNDSGSRQALTRGRENLPGESNATSSPCRTVSWKDFSFPQWVKLANYIHCCHTDLRGLTHLGMQASQVLGVSGPGCSPSQHCPPEKWASFTRCECEQHKLHQALSFWAFSTFPPTEGHGQLRAADSKQAHSSCISKALLLSLVTDTHINPGGRRLPAWLNPRLQMEKAQHQQKDSFQLTCTDMRRSAARQRQPHSYPVLELQCCGSAGPGLAPGSSDSSHCSTGWHPETPRTAWTSGVVLSCAQCSWPWPTHWDMHPALL